jgi:uncharacterized membrane protein (UPF0127 family)
MKITSRPTVACAFAALLSLLIGCSDPAPTTAPALPTTTMQIGSKTFTLEIASTESTRETGLMKRDSMPQDHGMIFAFKDTSRNPFWMKNTRIPLDIIYIDPNFKILAIKQMKPYDLTPTTSPAPYKWAIELNKDAATSAGVKPGDTLTIPAPAQSATE